MSNFDCAGCFKDKSEEAMELCYECYSDYINYRFARYVARNFPNSVRVFIRDVVDWLSWKIQIEHTHRYTISGCLIEPGEGLVIGWKYRCNCKDEIEVRT